MGVEIRFWLCGSGRGLLCQGSSYLLGMSSVSIIGRGITQDCSITLTRLIRPADRSFVSDTPGFGKKRFVAGEILAYEGCERRPLTSASWAAALPGIREIPWVPCAHETCGIPPLGKITPS